MTIRLNKVTRDLNVGISTVVDFLQKKGYSVEANPNAKITDEQYALLVKAFSKDKDLKIESEKISQGRQGKDRVKVAAATAQRTVEIETRVPEDIRPKFKPVGKIDLDSLRKKKVKPAVVEPAEEPVKSGKEAVKTIDETTPVAAAEETPKAIVPEVAPEVEAQPVAEQAQESTATVSEVQIEELPKTGQPEVNQPTCQQLTEKNEVQQQLIQPVNRETDTKPIRMEEKKESQATESVQRKEDEVFKIRPTEFKSKINVVGQIDLAALNQSTRPKKKSREEKKKEREEKDKLRQEQRKQMKDAIIKEIRKTDDKQDKTAGAEEAKKKKPPQEKPADKPAGSAAQDAIAAREKEKREKELEEKNKLAEKERDLNHRIAKERKENAKSGRDLADAQNRDFVTQKIQGWRDEIAKYQKDIESAEKMLSKFGATLEDDILKTPEQIAQERKDNVLRQKIDAYNQGAKVTFTKEEQARILEMQNAQNKARKLMADKEMNESYINDAEKSLNAYDRRREIEERNARANELKNRSAALKAAEDQLRIAKEANQPMEAVLKKIEEILKYGLPNQTV